MKAGRLMPPASGRLRSTATALAVAVVVAGGAVATRAQSAAKPTVDKSAKVGSGVYEIVVSADTVYVAAVGPRAEAAAKIVALDPKTLQTKKAIDLGADGAFGLGLNEQTQTLYTSNTRAGSVSAIDLKTGKLAATIKSEADPQAHTYRVLVDDQANRVYVSLASKDGKVWVIDGKTNTLAHTIEKVGVTTTGLALDRAANRLYAANLGANEVAVIDLATNQVTARYPTGGERPTQMAFDPATNRLFVTHQGTGDVRVLDTKTGTVLQTVKTGAGALGIGFSPKANRIYVANRQAGTITVIDGKTYEVVADLTAGSLPNTVAIDSRTGTVYVTNKAKSGGRGAPPVDDPNGDTVTMIKP